MITFLLFVILFAWLIHRYDPKMQLVRPIHEFYLNKVQYHNQVNRAEFKQIDQFLAKYNSFYRALSLDGRAKFIHRLEEFIAEKQFIGQDGIVIQDQHKWLIASGAIMITFGSDDYLYKNTRRILVYPQEFYNRAINKNLKGGSSKFQVMLSWNNIVKGFEDDKDALNLVIHEFAHAFEFALRYVSSTNKRFKAYQLLLDDIAEDAFEVLKTEKSSAFRKYAQTNRKEFFAVAMEYFFEQPENFMRNFPELYTHLSVALNLNPLNKEHDFRVDERFVDSMDRLLFKRPIPKELSTFVTSEKHTWPQWAIILGFVLCTPLFFTLTSEYNEVPLGKGLMWLTSIMAVSFFGYKKYYKSKYMAPFVFLFYISFGANAMILTGFMLLNNSIVNEYPERKVMVPIDKVYKRSIIIGSEASDGHDYQLFNPIRVDSNFIKQHHVSTSDSLLVTVFTEEHIPGWVIYNDISLNSIKR